MTIAATKRAVTTACLVFLVALSGIGGTAAAEGAAEGATVDQPAGSLETPADPWRLCAGAIAALEKTGTVPRHLLTAIAIVEAGRWSETAKRYVPWPWTITARGQGRFPEGKQDAVSTVDRLREEGVSNIDVGCMQVNLHYHPKAFADVDQAFDPDANVAYAARLLRSLFSDTGSWVHAVARYHSSTYYRNRLYRIRVMKLWHQLRGTYPQSR